MILHKKRHDGNVKPSPPACVGKTAFVGFSTRLTVPGFPRPTSHERRVQEDIEEKLRSLSTGTYYDWLEVHRTAAPKELKKAFTTLIKKYHPDRHPPEIVETAGRKLEAILTKVTQAQETLCNAQSRRRYDNSLRTEAPKGEVTAKPSIPPKPEPKPPTSSENMAERYYREAKKYFAQRDFHEVVKLMEEAVGTPRAFQSSLSMPPRASAVTKSEVAKECRGALQESSRARSVRHRVAHRIGRALRSRGACASSSGALHRSGGDRSGECDFANEVDCVGVIVGGIFEWRQVI